MCKPINGWTKQKIAGHIDANFVGISRDSTGCRYRGPYGSKCPVGMFIPDSQYHENMEGLGAYGLSVDFPKVKGFFPLPSDGMAALQRIHDNWRYSGEEVRLKEMLLEWIENNVD